MFSRDLRNAIVDVAPGDEREPVIRPDAGPIMLHVSDILIEQHDLESFAELVDAVRTRARDERFLRIDVKPPFADTPQNWEDVLESAFTSAAGR